MSIENDDFIELSFFQEDTVVDKHVAATPGLELLSVIEAPKKTLLERLPLGNTALAMMRVIRGMHLKTFLSRHRIFSQWNLKKIYKHIMTDSLYRNSIFNMTSAFVLSGLGFVFWTITAHAYKTEIVGIATTLVSLMTLLSGFTLLGLDSSLPRYLSQSANKNELINSSFAIVTIATLLSSAVFFLGLHVFSPQLLFLRSNVFYILSFIIFTIFASLNNLIDSIFVAFRATDNILIKNIISSIIKLVLLFAFIALGSYGIFAATASALTFGVFVGLIILHFKFNYKHSIYINSSLVKRLSRFSFANYVVNFVRIMPPLLLPVIILNILSAKYAAYFYFASMIQGFLLIIPTATQQSLLSEGSYNEAELKKHVKKAIATTLVILIPATTLVILFGDIVLQIFGKNYANETFQFLQLYCVSTIFTSLLLIASTIMNIKHKIKMLVISNVMAAVLTLCLSCAFISGKLVGIGWGWTLGQAIAGLVSLYFIIHNLSDTPKFLALPGRVQEVLE